MIVFLSPYLLTASAQTMSSYGRLDFSWTREDMNIVGWYCHLIFSRSMHTGSQPIEGFLASHSDVIIPISALVDWLALQVIPSVHSSDMTGSFSFIMIVFLSPYRLKAQIRATCNCPVHLLIQKLTFQLSFSVMIHRPVGIFEKQIPLLVWKSLKTSVYEQGINLEQYYCQCHPRPLGFVL